MPGKYSHSVVLADYTTRGIISLPEDQYERYKEFVPVTTPKSSPPSRLGRTKSAQTIYQPPVTSQDEWDGVDLRKVKQSLSANTTPVRARGLDHDSNTGQRDDLRAWDNYRERPMKSSPTLNHTKRADSSTAYQRQQHRTYEGSNSDAYEARPVDDYRSSNAERSHRNTVLQQTDSSKDLKQANIANAFDTRPRLLKDIQKNSSSSSHTLKGSIRSDVPPKISLRDTSTSSSRNVNNQAKSPEIRGLQPKSAFQSSLPVTPTTDTFPKVYDHPQARLGDIIQKSPTLDQIERSRSTESKASRHTQIWNPTPIAEPNFDGFSDGENGLTDYLDYSKQFSSHSRDSSQNSDLPIQRPESREQDSVASQQVFSVRSDRYRHTSSESTVDSAYGPKSASSKSSMNTPAFMNKSYESVHNPQQFSMSESSWTLPEIKEDLGFSPSIFEDHEGSSNALRLDFLDLELSSIGQISSGKDVNFDNDAVSELSAALPPPISRFKDEEDEFNANIAKLFGNSSRNDEAIKKASMTVGRHALSKKGFFSKFRSRG